MQLDARPLLKICFGKMLRWKTAEKDIFETQSVIHSLHYLYLRPTEHILTSVQMRKYNPGFDN